MNNNLKESMEENLTEKEIKLLERAAEVLGENVGTLYYQWSKNDLITALVDALEKAW